MTRSRLILCVLLWIAVGAFAAGMTLRTQHQRAQKRIGRVEITIADSTAHGQLVTRPMVERWLSESGIRTVGQRIDEVDLAALEELVARNGFVREVKASAGLSGVLRIVIRQRDPLYRLRVDGYDHYVTADGFVFRAPRSSSVYVPVVTGGYKPPFSPDEEGYVADMLERSRSSSQRAVADLEVRKYPFFRQEIEAEKEWRASRRRYCSKRLFESDEKFRRRVDTLRASKDRDRRTYRWRCREIELGVAAVEAEQNRERELQKKIEKRFSDFSKLTTFVERIEHDDFWRSEIVQLVGSSAHSGALEVELIPRSSRCRVLFGRLEGTEEKLGRLETFYRRGFPALGWESFTTVDVRFRGRVVCTR